MKTRLKAGGLILDLGHARRLGRDDVLVRALGKDCKVVVDATAGLGRDAAALAKLGYAVIAIERSPEVAALWRKEIARATSTLAFLEGDARVKLLELRDWGLTPDVVLLDPMYPDDDRRAAQERALVELRDLVGNDDDAAELLDVALAVCARVVVKRPKRAPALKEGVTHAWVGASTRFDLYVR